MIFNCLVCFETKTKKEIIILDCKKHTVCNECFENYLKVKQIIYEKKNNECIFICKKSKIELIQKCYTILKLENDNNEIVSQIINNFKQFIITELNNLSLIKEEKELISKHIINFIIIIFKNHFNITTEQEQEQEQKYKLNIKKDTAEILNIFIRESINNPLKDILYLINKHNKQECYEIIYNNLLTIIC